MSADRLVKYFDRVVDAPDAISRLRTFILELAVRGRLVRQDPNDESISLLIKRITAEKLRPDYGDLPNRQLPDSVGETRDMFTLPSSWQWIPATFPASIVSDLGKKVQTKDVLATGSFPVVDQGKVFVRGYCNDPDRVIRVDTPIILFGDHTRETKLIDFDFVVGADGVKLLKPIALLPQYYYIALKWLPLDSRGYGRHFRLLKASWLPLPPLQEQFRIVTKVDELLSLCDELAATRTKREAARDRFCSATIAPINTPDTDAAAFADGARFAIQSLKLLTTRPHHVKQFRETILNLAVRGKLVPQDSNDEPASQLLKRIAAERAPRHLAAMDFEVPEDERPFELPKGWLWTRLRVVGLTQTGTTPPSGNPALFGDAIPFITPANLTGRIIDYGVRGLSEIGIAQSRLVKTPSALMVCIGSSIGKVNVSERDICCNQQINAVTPYFEHSVGFLALTLQATYFQKLVRSKSGEATLPIISKAKWQNLPIPLAPLAEQSRVVQKFNDLTVLCDKLEATLLEGDKLRSRLLNSIIAETLTTRS